MQLLHRLGCMMCFLMSPAMLQFIWSMQYVWDSHATALSDPSTRPSMQGPCLPAPRASHQR